MDKKLVRIAVSVAFAAIAALPQAALAQGWQPTKTVEFVVPAGTGGGADQMARLLQGVISKNNLMKHDRRRSALDSACCTLLCIR